jgi:hypothetical protein
MAAAVVTYPAPLLAESSDTHHMRALARPVFVERYAGVGYARFAMRGRVTVEIEVSSPITHFTIFPAERVASTRVIGPVLTFDLPAPGRAASPASFPMISPRSNAASRPSCSRG